MPLIVLHGLFGSSENWRSISKRLSEEYRVYTIDLRNHGQSPHTDTMSYPAMAEDLHEFFDRAEISKAYLLGHSMGGKVAMQFATTYPERLAKLVVADMAPKTYPPSQRSIITALNALDLRGYKSFGAIDAALAPAIPETRVRQFLMKNITRRPDSGFHWRINLAGIAKGYHELIEAVVPAEKFHKPVLFIRGSHSDYIHDQDLPLIRQMFPQAELATIDGAGHWVHADAPETFLRTLTGFLKR